MSDTRPDCEVIPLDPRVNLLICKYIPFMAQGDSPDSPQVLFIHTPGHAKQFESVGLAQDLDHAIKYVKSLDKKYLLEVI